MSELQWLGASALMTALIWLVYVPNRMVVLGIPRTLGNPSPTDPPLAPWAQRATAAHRNAVENLVVFAALLLASHALGTSCGITRVAAMAYFAARLTIWWSTSVASPCCAHWPLPPAGPARLRWGSACWERSDGA